MASLSRSFGSSVNLLLPTKRIRLPQNQKHNWKKVFRKTNSCVYKWQSIHTRFEYYMTKPVWSVCYGLECLNFEGSSYSQLPGSLSPDYISACKANFSPTESSFPTIRYRYYIYFISVFCCTFKSQRNILASY